MDIGHVQEALFPNRIRPQIRIAMIKSALILNECQTFSIQLDSRHASVQRMINKKIGSNESNEMKEYNLCATSYIWFKFNASDKFMS